MPLTKKGEKILNTMESEYGTEHGKEVFYASKNAGTISGVDSRRAAINRIMDSRRSRLAGDGPFQKLENKLSHEKGVENPAAVAAAAGRKKLGQAEMTRRSEQGRK